MKRWKARAGAHLRGRAESESCCTPGGRPTVTTWQETIARRLREFHLDSIRNQMLVFAVAATLVPALALTVVSSRKSQGSIGDQIAQEQRGTSTEAAWEIDQWLGDRLRDLRVAATAYAVADLLQRLAPRAAAGGDLYVMTDQGRLILKSRVSSADLMRTKLPMAQELLDREGSTVEYRRADGQNVIGTLRRVPALRWAAV